MKLCGICGAQMPDEAVICTNCGAQFQAGQVPPRFDYQQQPYQQTGYQQPYVQMNGGSYPGKGKAIFSLVYGILGLVLSMIFGWTVIVPVISLILCIVGIVLGVQARNIISAGMPGRSLATAGFVCGIIGAVFSGIVAVSCFCFWACAGAGAEWFSSYPSSYYSIVLFG